MRSRILMLLGVLAWAGCAQAQAPATEGPSPPAAADDGSLPPDMTLPVMINGQGPFRFAIDSGSTTTLIASELADRLQLPARGQVRVHAMSGTASLRTVEIDDLQISSIGRRDVRVAAVPREHLGVDGLIGLNLLRRQRVILDFVGRTIRIEPSAAAAETPKEEKADGSEIVVRARLRHGQLVMADAEADGQKVWVIVDSGSQSSVGNLKLMQLLARDVPAFAITPVSLMDVIGRATNAQYTMVERLRLGGMALSPIPLAFADAHPFKLFGLLKKPSLLLGMETLQNFSRVDIDFGTRKVSFQIEKGKLLPARKAF
jgi:predicted aspartyl protease